MKFNYFQICQNLLKDLSKRQKEVILRRFNLKNGRQRETLESIGKSFGITRERVRQIEKDGLLRIRPKAKQYQKVFQYFKSYLKERGSLKKEDILLNELGGENQNPQVYFLLTLGEGFEIFGDSEDFYSFWLINQNSAKKAKEVLDFLSQKLEEIKRPISFREISSFFSLKNLVLETFLEISKKIKKNEEGLYGLKDWPEISPRGVKDKAYLVFKKAGKPLHFTEVANFIGKDALLQTVHNELIKDPRFVLVGRGIYALKDWGYEPGQVKDVILKVLKEEGKPLRKEEILEKVLEQRIVKENTIFLNLSNKKYFLKNSEGKYIIREI